MKLVWATNFQASESLSSQTNKAPKVRANTRSFTASSSPTFRLPCLSHMSYLFNPHIEGLLSGTMTWAFSIIMAFMHLSRLK